MLSLFFPYRVPFFYRWHSRLSLSFDHFIVCLKWWRLILFLRLPANWEYYFAFIEFFKHFLSVYISHFYSLCLVFFLAMFCSVLRAFLFMLVFFSVSCFVWSSPVITYSFRTNLFFCHFVALIKDYDQCWFYLNSLLFFYRLPFNVYLSLMPVFNFRTTQTDDDDDDDDYSLHFFIIAIISAIVLCS